MVTDVREFINKIYPEHDRTSCDDTKLYNGLYSNDGYTRCARCTLLQLEDRPLPKSHKAFIVFNINDKLAEDEKYD